MLSAATTRPRRPLTPIPHAASASIPLRQLPSSAHPDSSTEDDDNDYIDTRYRQRWRDEEESLSSGESWVGEEEEVRELRREGRVLAGDGGVEMRSLKKKVAKTFKKRKSVGKSKTTHLSPRNKKIVIGVVIALIILVGGLLAWKFGSDVKDFVTFPELKTPEDLTSDIASVGKKVASGVEKGANCVGNFFKGKIGC
ncbi:hypothetical protein JCM8097_002971 [Rhodosporidiobolus ruineniae]